jgi:hypothetical protein
MTALLSQTLTGAEARNPKDPRTHILCAVAC